MDTSIFHFTGIFYTHDRYIESETLTLKYNFFIRFLQKEIEKKKMYYNKSFAFFIYIGIVHALIRIIVRSFWKQL